MACIALITDLQIWLLLVSGLVGAVMGINRTIKTRQLESASLQLAAGIMGLILISATLYAVLAGARSAALSGYTLQLMIIMGLSLCARQLEKIPATAVMVILLLSFTIFSISHWGLPEILQRPDTKKIAILAAVGVLSIAVLVLATIEKIIDIILNALGLGPVVTVISVLGVADAVVMFVTGDKRGLGMYI